MYDQPRRPTETERAVPDRTVWKSMSLQRQTEVAPHICQRGSDIWQVLPYMGNELFPAKVVPYFIYGYVIIFGTCGWNMEHSTPKAIPYFIPLIYHHLWSMGAEYGNYYTAKVIPYFISFVSLFASTVLAGGGVLRGPGLLRLSPCLWEHVRNSSILSFCVEGSFLLHLRKHVRNPPHV